MSSTSKRSEPLFPLWGNRRIGELIAAGAPAQAVILCGPKGSGRNTAALRLAAACLCTAGERPCGRCEACAAVARGEHQDLRLLAPPEGKQAIPIDEVRAMRAEAYVRPVQGEHKVFILRRAEGMQPAAQNVLLKVLEEPPPYARFILITEREEALLPTVRSRCRLFHTEPLSEADGLAVLTARNPAATREACAAALAACGGWAGPALERLRDDRRREQAAALDFVRGVLGRSERDMFTSLSALERASREELAVFLDTLSAVYTAALELRCGQRPQGAGAEAEQLCRRLSVGLLLRLRDIAEDLRGGVEFNVRPMTAAVALCAQTAQALSL